MARRKIETPLTSKHRRPLPPQDDLHRLLLYVPETGEFYWRPRPATTGALRSWNAKYPGKPIRNRVSGGYAAIVLHGVMYKAHRLAWKYVYGVDPAHEIDHVDGNPQNNRIANLREADDSQQMRNKRAYKSNSLGLKGVTFDKASQRYQARIRRDGRTIYFSYHLTPEEAHAAYREANERLFGEFARSN